MELFLKKKKDTKFKVHYIHLFLQFSLSVSVSRRKQKLQILTIRSTSEKNRTLQKPNLHQTYLFKREDANVMEVLRKTKMTSCVWKTIVYFKNRENQSHKLRKN